MYTRGIGEIKTPLKMITVKRLTVPAEMWCVEKKSIEPKNKKISWGHRQFSGRLDSRRLGKDNFVMRSPCSHTYEIL